MGTHPKAVPPPGTENEYAVPSAELQAGPVTGAAVLTATADAARVLWTKERRSVMTSKEPYTAGQVRKATEQSAEAWKKGTKKLFDQAGTIPAMPQVDLNQPVEQYFDFVQRTVDLNRELATRWAELVTTLSGGTRERAESFSRIVKDQADTLAGMAAQQAQKTEQIARDQAEQEQEQERKAEEAEKAKAREAKRVEREEARKAQQEAEEAEEAEKAQAREAKRLEREKARKAQERAREPYEGLTKAELSDQLAGRGLPKTGNIDDLINRLVEADNNN
jgi:septal ring factor EnvC (AmiA/AmiB activator)